MTNTSDKTIAGKIDTSDEACERACDRLALALAPIPITAGRVPRLAQDFKDLIRALCAERDEAKHEAKNWKSSCEFNNRSRLNWRERAEALESLSRRKEGDVPAGWQLVPKEATIVMKQAGYCAWLHADKTQVYGEAIFDRAYNAALAVAPPPETAKEATPPGPFVGDPGYRSGGDEAAKLHDREMTEVRHSSKEAQR